MLETLKKTTDGVFVSAEKSTQIKKEIKTIVDFKKKIKECSVNEITKILEIILGGGILLEASDIHIEPLEESAKIRTRIDGILQDAAEINREIYEKILSRIKLLSGIKLNVSDRPQDGRFSVLIESLIVEVRSSTLPAEKGESIVLRILNPKSLLNLESLGLRNDLFEMFKKEIKKPNGMIIVTGPTGSGKTTTLYAFLKKIQKPEIKIITIEDPIEYHLKGVSQTQVDPKKGYDFASGLQSIMRQDPDVILVGEIRNPKTCKIALQAALTGHLVLTTLHTNDAAGTIARLTSLEGELINIGPAINLIIAQRLVRKVCKKCVKLKRASFSALNKIKKNLKGIPKEIKLPKIKMGLKIPETKGCKYCNYTGYKGRVGIFETILVNDNMERFILKNPSIASFRKEAIKKGMATIKQDGLIKALKGVTTLEEVERVAGE